MGKKNGAVFLLLSIVWTSYGRAPFECFKRTDHLLNAKREQIDGLAPEARERLSRLFSEVPRTGRRFVPQTPFRRRAVSDTLDRVIEEEGRFDGLFLEGVRDSSSLSPEERRALHLIFNREWWFRGGRSSFYRKPTVARFLRVSYHIRRRYGSPGDHLQRFLHEIAQTSLWERMRNRYSYIGNIYRHINDSPHSSDLLVALKREQKNLIDELGRADDEARPPLEAQREHLDYLVAVIDTQAQALDSRPRRLSRVGYWAPELFEKGEDFIVGYAKYVVAAFIVTWWFADDEQAATALPSNEALPVAQWSSPVEESPPEESPLTPEDEILIQCNAGLRPVEECLELLNNQ